MSDSSPSDSGTTPEPAVSPSAEKKRTVIPVHPLLFVFFPYLAFYAQNYGKAPLAEIFSAIAKSLVYAAAVFLVLLLLTRQVRKAALATSILVLPFFAFGHIMALFPRSVQDNPQIVIGIGLLTMVALIALVLRTRQPLYDATSGLNVMALLLLLPSLWTIALNFSIYMGHSENYSGATSTPSPAHTTITVNRHLPETPQDVPDVYYIILDAYGRADRLQTYYGYDNAPFLKALKARGFFIATHSEANYDQTPLCLASALSMNYLDPPIGQKLDPEKLRLKVDDNAVIDALRPKGYHYIDIASGLEESRIETADMVLNDEPDLSVVEGQVFNMTAIGALKAEQRQRFDRHRRRLNGGFDNTIKAAALPYPKFVFTHILAPHPPFVFNTDGSPVNPKGIMNMADASDLLELMSKADYRRSYVAQLQYVNRRTLEMVDAILKQSKHKPIIILQGDHGSRMNLNWQSLAKTDLREPFSNLNAYLVPESVRPHLTDKITAVNSFRILLTHAFGIKDLPRLPDRNFYSTEDEPYKFIDVTDSLNKLVGASPTDLHRSREARTSTANGLRFAQ